RVSRWLMPPFRKMRIQDSAWAGRALAIARRRRKPLRDAHAAAYEPRSRNCRRLVGHGNGGAGLRMVHRPVQSVLIRYINRQALQEIRLIQGSTGDQPD